MNLEHAWLSLTNFCAAATVYFFGGFENYLQTLLVLMIIDFLTGLFKAWYDKKLESRKGVIGIAKKVLMFVVVTIAVIMQRLFNDAMPLRETVIGFYIANELLSISENIGNFLPIPEVLKKAIIKLQSEKMIKEEKKEIKDSEIK